MISDQKNKKLIQDFCNNISEISKAISAIQFL